MEPRTKEWLPEEFVVAMAMDAFRVCVGMQPRNFNVNDITRWLEFNRAILAQDEGRD